MGKASKIKKAKMSKKAFEDFVAKNCEEVKFKVTDLFGYYEKGDIIKAYKITGEGSQSMLYHPSSKTGCGCFLVSQKVAGKDYYIDVKGEDSNWVNFEE